jgi:hypothetical protein
LGKRHCASVEPAVWNLGKNCRVEPRNGTQFCTGFSDTRTGGLSRYRVSIPGRVKPEHRGELAEVNGAGAASVEKA